MITSWPHVGIFDCTYEDFVLNNAIALSGKVFFDNLVGSNFLNSTSLNILEVSLLS